MATRCSSATSPAPTSRSRRSEGAHGIFDSLHDTLLALPDESELWPGHIGGSLCGGPGIDMKVGSTIGFERRHNPAPAIDDEDEFVACCDAQLGPSRPTSSRSSSSTAVRWSPGPDVRALTPRQVERKQAPGALVVDVRTDLQFDEAHIQGAVCVPRCTAVSAPSSRGWPAATRRSSSSGATTPTPRHAAGLAAAVGSSKRRRLPRGRHDELAAGDAADGLVARIDVARCTARATGAAGPRRARAAEWDAGHIPGSLHVPYHDLDGMPDGIDPERPVAVICASGQRSAVGAGLVQRLGATHVVHVAGGGVGTWQRNGWPITQAETSVTA